MKALITGAKYALDWTSDKKYADIPVKGTSVSWFYLDGKEGTSATWQNPVATAQGSSKYAWLYDNLYLCSDYGCNISDNNKYGYGTSGYTNNTSGYWTSTPMFGNSLRVWFVYGYGYFNYTNASIGNYFGVRPVITISKSILK